MHCQYTKDGICRLCSQPSETREIRICVKGKPLSAAADRKLAGDALKEFLESLGVAQLYEDCRKEMGLPPCGGCGARQQWLNRVDAWVRKKLGKL